ncbi:hypothetical protein [Pseudomarimonas salicorniae]|uniref:DUF4129 domain-containing protein n=1 Tax=Pseudomarimonas salicorniae TaxID=2933270 RepID=A0ABT0GL98_9GAMM|nr:hypothetical protein [Lysobacter sp. CAU 1642]MCK7595312.1 hypothetical protein [Lysobacter sp. CAU 1642]
MSSTVVRSERFSLSVWDWLLVIVIGAIIWLVFAAAGGSFAAALGEATVYLGFVVGLSYSFGRGRWTKAAGRAKAGRWAFRILFLLLACAVLFVSMVRLVGYASGKAGAQQLMETTSALRAALDADADSGQIRSAFHQIATEKLEAAASSPVIERPFRMIATELAVETLRPQLELAEVTSRLVELGPLAPATLASEQSRREVLTSAEAMLVAIEASREAVFSIEKRAEAAIVDQPSSRAAREAFLDPIRIFRQHAEATFPAPELVNWANAIIALHAYLDAHVDAWRIDSEGVLHASAAERQEITKLLEGVKLASARLAD